MGSWKAAWSLLNRACDDFSDRKYDFSDSYCCSARVTHFSKLSHLVLAYLITWWCSWSQNPEYSTSRFFLLLEWSNQQYRSTRISDTSNPVASVKADAAAADVLWTTWHWQPLKNTSGFFFCTIVLIECRLPMFTLVFSTPTATQLLHGTSNYVIQRSMALNISRAVPLGVMHISKRLVLTLPALTSNIRTVRGFIFSKPLLFDPSVASAYG